MGRPESPLTGPRHRIALASRLRELRALVGATYAEMACHSEDISEATLKRVASGRGPVPRWRRVEEYRAICVKLAVGNERDVILQGMDLEYLWVMARREERNTLRLAKPRPRFIRDQADLSYALYVLYERQGAPPLRDVQRLAGGAVHLPLATAARIVQRQALPADVRQYLAFLRGCVVPEQHFPTWLDAWEKVSVARLPPHRLIPRFLDGEIKEFHIQFLPS